jgi:hypothetical protein
VFAGAGLLGFLVHCPQAEAKNYCQQSQNTNANAQALQSWSKIGEGAGSEIEGDAH